MPPVTAPASFASLPLHWSDTGRKLGIGHTAVSAISMAIKTETVGKPNFRGLQWRVLAAGDTLPRLQGSTSMRPGRIEVRKQLPFSRNRILDKRLYRYVDVGLKERLFPANWYIDNVAISTEY